MLPKINALPGSQGAAAPRNRNVQIGLRQYAAHMRRHVIRALCSVYEHRVAIRDLSRHESLKISHNVRICVLAQHQRGTGVTNENVARAGFDSGFSNNPPHISTEVVGTSTVSLNPQFLACDHSTGTYGVP